MRKLLRLMHRDLAALAAEAGALVSLIIVAVAAEGVTSAATPEAQTDALYLGLAALCWMGICTAAAHRISAAETLDEHLAAWVSDKPRRA